MSNRKRLKQHARENRTNSTKSEQIMWRLLRGHQLGSLKFRRQHVIEPFVVDFACVSEKLIIEIDGGYHDQVVPADLSRQKFLESLGWRVLRFTSDDVEQNAEAVVTAIARLLGTELHYFSKSNSQSGMLKSRSVKERENSDKSQSI